MATQTQQTDTEIGADGELTIDDVETPAELQEWAVGYAETAVEEYDMDVMLDRVEWEINTSGRCKRRAGQMKHKKFPFRTKIGVPLDWEKVLEILEDVDDDPRDVTIELTWDAFQADNFDADDMRETVLHELVHAEQYHKFGVGDHGSWFKARAEEIGASLECPLFKEPKYLVKCRACGQVVAHRYQASKLTRVPEQYTAECCDAPLKCEETGA